MYKVIRIDNNTVYSDNHDIMHHKFSRKLVYTIGGNNII